MVVKRMRNRIKALLSREDGASMIVVMLVAVALLLTVPVFVDYASLHYTRRVTQTGADEAALAAAKIGRASCRERV